MKHLNVIVILFTLICLLCSCGLGNSVPHIASDSDIENKYTEVSYTAEDMRFTDGDFVFFKLSGLFESYTPDSDCMLSTSAKTSVIYTRQGATDNGFGLSTSRLVAPGDSDLDDFYSEYKIADGYALECVKSALSSRADGFITGESDIPALDGESSRVSIGAYLDGEEWKPLDTSALMALFGYTSDADLTGIERLTVISAYADASGELVRMCVYRGDVPFFKSLNDELYSDFAESVSEAESAEHPGETTAGEAETTTAEVPENTSVQSV